VALGLALVDRRSRVVDRLHEGAEVGVLPALARHHGKDADRPEEEDAHAEDAPEDRQEPPLAGLELFESLTQVHRPPSVFSGFAEAPGFAEAEAGDAESAGSPAAAGFFFLSSHLRSNSITYFCLFPEA